MLISSCLALRRKQLHACCHSLRSCCVHKPAPLLFTGAAGSGNNGGGSNNNDGDDNEGGEGDDDNAGGESAVCIILLLLLTHLAVGGLHEGA
jgi:hypothetical protein